MVEDIVDDALAPQRRRFDKTAAEPVPPPEDGIARAAELMRSGKLFRYGEEKGGLTEVAALEREFAGWIGKRYVAAVNSCGCALFLTLRALGVRPGDEVLCNAFTLAPVPGAVVHAGATARFVDIAEDLTVDLDDLARKLDGTRARVFLLSHMRGHFAHLDRIAEMCAAAGVKLVEDCAHTPGAEWDGRMVGSFGDVSCFSAQGYKHVNSGEGGLIATDDAEVAAKAILMSGSYMLYGQNGAAPELETFEALRDETPNFSMRMTNMAAALLRPQFRELPGWVERWNDSYRRLEAGLARTPDVAVIPRGEKEAYVGSSIQFRVTAPADRIGRFIEIAQSRGVFLKWFGAERTAGFTSRYDQWGYAATQARLPTTDRMLAGLIDMRVALSFTPEDCETIVAVIREALEDASAEEAEFDRSCQQRS